jgi:E3 ubiquitin-protein ligase HUWE1
MLCFSVALNNIVRLMLRKGLIMDLARVPHCLDLSSPNMHVTVNAALKPLETLTRIVNHPIPPAPKSKKSNTQETAAQTTGMCMLIPKPKVIN